MVFRVSQRMFCVSQRWQEDGKSGWSTLFYVLANSRKAVMAGLREMVLLDKNQQFRVRAVADEHVTREMSYGARDWRTA